MSQLSEVGSEFPSYLKDKYRFEEMGMQINTDLSKRVVVESSKIPWVDSPLAGVERRMLERDGEEVARATSLVCYAPGTLLPHKAV